MDDRTLLELAAKAAGIEVTWHCPPDEVEKWADELATTEGIWLRGGRTPSNSQYWNPLTDDGDAPRLAVKLGIGLGFHQQHMQITAYEPCPHEGFHREDVEDHLDLAGLSAATRRAIVRAAAAIAQQTERVKGETR